MSKNGLVRGVSIGVQGSCLWVPQCAIAGRVHIGWTARQNEGVQPLQPLCKFFPLLFEKYFERFPSRFSDSLKIEVQFNPRPTGLFLRGAPGDTHTGAAGSA